MPFHFRPCSIRFQHRRSSFKELQYICDGDSNGVLYFAGTSYGEHQWVNPVLSKVSLSRSYYFCFTSIFLICCLQAKCNHQKIAITASSPISRFTDPKVLASRTYQVSVMRKPNLISTSSIHKMFSRNITEISLFDCRVHLLLDRVLRMEKTALGGWLTLAMTTRLFQKLHNIG